MTEPASIFRTNFTRAVAGILVFTLVISLPAQLIYAENILRYWPENSWDQLQDKFSLWDFVDLYLYFSPPAALVTVPAWVVLHYFNVRSPVAAAALGGIVAAMLVTHRHWGCGTGVQGCDPTPILATAGISAIVGAMSALVAWRIAYSRTPVVND